MKALFAVVLLACVWCACRTAPYTGRHQFLLTSESEEASLGLQSYEQVKKENKISADPVATAMVRRVGERIARAADRPDYKWEFTLIDDPKTVNAFCLPGGKVAVYSGILPLAKDETGLAVVLGHEVSHALARHGGERMTDALIAQAGGVALSVALAQKPDQTRALFAAAYGAGATVGVLLPFSRRQESEADHIGLILMAKAGYDPHAAVEFWGRMVQESKGRKAPPAFLSDHPADETRVHNIEKWLPEAMKYYHPQP